MVWINWTETIGVIVSNASSTLTGDVFMTLLSIMMIILCLALALKIPIEFTVPIILPLIITCMIEYGEFYILGAVAGIYIAGVMAKMFILS